MWPLLSSGHALSFRKWNCKEQFWSLFRRQQCFLGGRDLSKSFYQPVVWRVNLWRQTWHRDHWNHKEILRFSNCHLQFLQFVFHFSQLILNLKSESTVAHRVSHSPFSMEHVCPRMRFLRFWGISDSEWILLKWPDEWGSKFWIHNTCKKVKSDF